MPHPRTSSSSDEMLSTPKVPYPDSAGLLLSPSRGAPPKRGGSTGSGGGGAGHINGGDNNNFELGGSGEGEMLMTPKPLWTPSSARDHLPIAFSPGKTAPLTAASRRP